MRCYLVRHAQTAWNGENRLQGTSDIALSALGQEQAKRLSVYFGVVHADGHPIAALYTSHLKRSRETADWIARQTGVTPIVEPALAEMGLGDWEGLTPEEIDGRFDGAYERWRQEPGRVVIPQAEPLRVFRGRVRDAFERILAAQREGSVVIVSHGGVLASFLADCLDADYERVLRKLVLENAGVSAVDAYTRPPHILWVNHTAHLAV